MRTRAGLVILVVAAAALAGWWWRRHTRAVPTPAVVAAPPAAPSCVRVRIDVRDADGKPIVATIHQERSAWPTDASGSFEHCFRLDAFLSISADGYQPRGLTPYSRRGPLRVILQRSSIIRGRVVEDVTGAPLAGIRVGSETSAADGSFTIGGLAAGSHTFAGRGGEWETPPVTVTLGAGQEAPITLRASRAFAVRGRVLRDDGAPVSAATVCLGVESPCAVTDAEGRFEVRTATRGERRVGVLGRQVRPSRVVLAPGAPELTLHVAPPVEPATVRGRVVRLGVAVAGVLVYDTRFPWTAVATDPDGRFELRADPGRITLEAHARELFALGGPTTLTLAPGEVRDLELELQHEGGIGGYVVDLDDRPVHDVMVRVRDDQTGETAAVRTRRDGSFFVAPILPGIYRTEVSPPLDSCTGFVDTPRPPVVVATSDTRVTGLRFVVDTRTATIVGRAVDATGRSIAGATIATDPLTSCSFVVEENVTDGEGRFTVTALVAAKTRVIVHDGVRWGRRRSTAPQVATSLSSSTSQSPPPRRATSARASACVRPTKPARRCETRCAARGTSPSAAPMAPASSRSTCRPVSRCPSPAATPSNRASRALAPSWPSPAPSRSSTSPWCCSDYAALRTIPTTDVSAMTAPAPMRNTIVTVSPSELRRLITAL